MGWLVGSFVRSFVGRLVGWLVGWLVGCLVGWLIGWSVGRTVGRSVGRLFAWVVNCYFSSSLNQSSNLPTLTVFLIIFDDQFQVILLQAVTKSVLVSSPS
jgi:tetrahydromethanopterin S-methyltransferase subunit G